MYSISGDHALAHSRPLLRARRWRRSATLTAWVFGCSAVCALYLGLALAIGNEGGALSGWFVPDGITLLTRARDDARIPAAELFADYPASAALAVINAWLVAVHPLLPALFNFVLLILIFGSLARHGAAWPPTLLLLVPYYLAAFPLPSKDILVAGLLLLVVRNFGAVDRARLLLPLVITAAMYFVRDGYALILLVSLMLIRATEAWRIPPKLLVLGIAAAASTFWLLFESVLQDSFLYVRAINIAAVSEVLNVESFAQPLDYLVRLFGNATNLAFRPVPLDTGGSLYVLSLCYWVSGVTLLHTLHCCWRALGSPMVRDRRLGLLGLLSLLLVSVMPYVQPRYLLPLCLLIPMFSFSSLAMLRRSLAVIVPLSLAAASLYVYIGNYPPLAEPEPFTLSTGAF